MARSGWSCSGTRLARRPTRTGAGRHRSSRRCAARLFCRRSSWPGAASALSTFRTRPMLRAPDVARRLPIGFGAVLLTGVLMLPIGAFGIREIVTTTWRQLSGPAEMVDFLAFYTGGRLLLQDPNRLYDPVAWMQLQTILHAGPQPVLEFWNPPHTALLFAPLAAL